MHEPNYGISCILNKICWIRRGVILKSSPLLSCRLACFSLLKFTLVTQKLTNFTGLQTFFLQHLVAKCPYLYSVLGSTGLQRCALCWAREPPALSPPLPPHPPSLLLLPPPSATPAYTWLYKLSILFATRSGVSHMTPIGIISVLFQRFFLPSINYCDQKGTRCWTANDEHCHRQSVMSYSFFLASFSFPFLLSMPAKVG